MVDQKVAWEGNPGFHRQHPWKPGETTHVDAPLADLVKRHNLPALKPWMKAWTQGARAATLRGDLEAAAPHLQVARGLPARLVREVAEAQAMRNSILRALEGFDGVRAELEELEMEPALPVLLRWADLLEFELDPELRKTVEKSFKTGRVFRWRAVLRLYEQTRKRVEKGKPLRESAARLRTRLERHASPMVKRLGAELDAALAGEDDDEVARVLDNASTLPARWLAADYLKLR